MKKYAPAIYVIIGILMMDVLLFRENSDILTKIMAGYFLLGALWLLSHGARLNMEQRGIPGKVRIGIMLVHVLAVFALPCLVILGSFFTIACIANILQ